MKIAIKKLSQNTVLIEKEYTNASAGTGNDITGPTWMLIEVWTNKETSHLVDGSKIKVPKGKHIVFIPPFDWTSEYAEPMTKWRVKGLLSTSRLPKEAPTRACLTQSNLPFPSSDADALTYLRTMKEVSTISRAPHPDPTAARVKQMIDRHFARDISMEEIAKTLKSSNAYLTRRFKASFGEPPVYYKRGLKVTVAMLALSLGKSPAVAAELAGYNDLGRFYKQFKEYMKLTPAMHQPRGRKVKKRQD